MRRDVYHGDALEWLKSHQPLTASSIITSLPDVSELPALNLEAWQGWFEDAALAVLNAVPSDGVVIFFQSDIRQQGRWIDKGELVARAARRADSQLLFHKIVCRRAAGTVTLGRASYSHLLAFSKALRPKPAPGRTTADVLLDAGYMPGKKSMGANACVDACNFIARETRATCIVDPFCGFGTVLAVANAVGLDAIGVDLSTRMCRRARQLQLTSDHLGEAFRTLSELRTESRPAPSDP